MRRAESRVRRPEKSWPPASLLRAVARHADEGPSVRRGREGRWRRAEPGSLAFPSPAERAQGNHGRAARGFEGGEAFATFWWRGFWCLRGAPDQLRNRLAQPLAGRPGEGDGVSVGFSVERDRGPHGSTVCGGAALSISGCHIAPRGISSSPPRAESLRSSTNKTPRFCPHHGWRHAPGERAAWPLCPESHHYEIKFDQAGRDLFRERK